MIRPRPAGSGRPPDSLALLAARVDDRLAVVVGAERERWAALEADLAGPFGEIERMVAAGGKRLRPAFCHWAFVGSGGDRDDARVIDAGAAFELMHACALFHDDVMDDAATRRGAPTTHTIYTAEHERDGLGRGVTALRRGCRHPRRRPRLRARRPAPRRRARRGVADVERAAHRAQRRAVPRPPGRGRAASVDSPRPSGSPATRAASTASSDRCTSAPCWPLPSVPASCSRR